MKYLFKIKSMNKENWINKTKVQTYLFNFLPFILNTFFLYLCLTVQTLTASTGTERLRIKRSLKKGKVTKNSTIHFGIMCYCCRLALMLAAPANRN